MISQLDFHCDVKGCVRLIYPILLSHTAIIILSHTTGYMGEKYWYTGLFSPCGIFALSHMGMQKFLP